MAKRKQLEYRVFISHSTKDKWIAVQLDKMIQACGVATFRDDRDLESGARIPEEIRAQLDQSDELLVVWTPQALASKWIDMEICIAFAFELHMVAVRYLTTAESLPPCMSSLQSLELTVADVDKYLEDLTKRSKLARGAK